VTITTTIEPAVHAWCVANDVPERRDPVLRKCSICGILVVPNSDDDNGLSDERYKGGPICNDCAKHGVVPNPRRRLKQRGVQICYRIGAPDEDAENERTVQGYIKNRQTKYRYCRIDGCGKLLSHSNRSGLCRSHALVARHEREREAKESER